MDILHAIILGIVQGLTEFLPVSSSGHLEIAKVLLNDESIGKQSMLMTVVLHGATALSTIYIFWKDIKDIIKGLFSADKNKVSFSLKIILSMIPSVIVGVVWEKQIETLFGDNLELVGAMLIITALLLYCADKAKSTDKNVSFVHSIIIGISQAIAIFPGISRSGATISTSVMLGVDKEKSARFSFLMVVPLILGKILKDILSGDISFTSTESLPLFFGFISAFFVGLFACKLMIKIVKKSKLKYFALYCIVVGGSIIYYSVYNA
ncbi:MAG: UDP-diphosphatase [Flavobacteriales bacterium]|nr:UDP-diphosphatase [Flavobacteriales bacterium]|tara:strand:+ start:15867 stop:16661 length:795 start_codon:yes stop_codon:yes gene_type:complete